MKFVVGFLISLCVGQSSFATTCRQLWRVSNTLQIFQRMASFGERGYFGASIRDPDNYRSLDEAKRLITIFDKAYLDAATSLQLPIEAILTFADTELAQRAAQELQHEFFKTDENAPGGFALALEESEMNLQRRAAEVIFIYMQQALEDEDQDLSSIKWQSLLALSEGGVPKRLRRIVEILLDERGIYARHYFNKDLYFEAEVVKFLSQPNFPAELQVRRKFHPVIAQFLSQTPTTKELKPYRVVVKEGEIKFEPISKTRTDPQN